MKTTLVAPYTYDMTVSYHEPVTGTQVARMSWEIPSELLSKLLLGTADNGLYEDVRSQFALWATTQPHAVFNDFADAWNQFVAPRAGMARPVVLLPGTPCSRCTSLRHRQHDASRSSGIPRCPECQGTGRKPPRAVGAAYAKPTTASVSLDSTPLTQTGT